MMAAGQAASAGADVWLLEKNPSLGRKLLLTGQGRCNLTNNLDVKQFIADCGPKAKFLYGALTRFSNQDTLDFFESLGLRTKLERGGRYFPESDDSHDVLRALERFLHQNHVKVEKGVKVEKVEKAGGRFRVAGEKTEYNSTKLIIATGGMSYPATGSTGDGYCMARELGHAIVAPRPSDVPITIREQYIPELQGLSLKNIELTFSQGRKTAAYFGEMLFTHFGISGPIVLDASRTVGPWLDGGEVACSLDLKPGLSPDKLDERLRRDISAQGRKRYRGFLKGLLPAAMIPVFAERSGIGQDTAMSQTTASQRRTMAELLKGFRFTATGLRGFEEAVVTAGGVDAREAGPATMESKIVPSLYLCGEVLDVDGPCGGYNLQIAWSTGFAAGSSAAARR